MDKIHRKQAIGSMFEVVKRVEMYVWNGHVCPAWREINKIKPMLQDLPEYNEIFYALSQNLLDGRQIQAHAETLRFRDRLLRDIQTQTTP